VVKIPFLFDYIVQGLSDIDIANCAQVCQEWNQLFTPGLCQTASKLQSKDFAKFGHHVQHFRAHQPQVMDQVRSNCHGLKDVHFNFRNPRHDFDRCFLGLDSVKPDPAVETSASLYERWLQRPDQTPNAFLSNTIEKIELKMSGESTMRDI